CTYVQGNESLGYAHGAQLGQHGLVKMQARSWGGYRTWFCGIDGLVALVVVLVGSVLDIRRQRCGAVLVEQVKYAFRKLQFKKLSLASTYADGKRIGHQQFAAWLR